jgi:hypothetical protein
MADMAHQKSGGTEIPRPHQVEAVVKEPARPAPPTKNRRKASAIDVLQVIVMLVLIALILYGRLSRGEDVFFGDEIPAWDKRV